MRLSCPRMGGVARMYSCELGQGQIKMPALPDKERSAMRGIGGKGCPLLSRSPQSRLWRDCIIARLRLTPRMRQSSKPAVHTRNHNILIHYKDGLMGGRIRGAPHRHPQGLSILRTSKSRAQKTNTEKALGMAGGVGGTPHTGGDAPSYLFFEPFNTRFF